MRTSPLRYEHLVELGCDLIQGYVVAAPVAPSRLNSMMNAARSAPSEAA